MELRSTGTCKSRVGTSVYLQAVCMAILPLAITCNAGRSTQSSPTSRQVPWTSIETTHRDDPLFFLLSVGDSAALALELPWASVRAVK